MPKASPPHVLLLLLFAFAFVYRLLLMLWAGYPPGADIGLHNSVIHSIVGSGNVDFLYNFFHMGGGVSLTFPGYHIFTAGVILMTGMPEFLAHTFVVSLFSALTVLCAFLITKKVWTIAPAVIVAFLVAISRFDIEMLTWAGYPNVVALMLIPLTYYLFLEKDRFSKVPYLLSTSILVASIFLAHSLSAVMFIGIFAPLVLFVVLWPKILGVSRKSVLYWVLPVVLGAILILPFLIQVIPAYFQEYGSVEITNATLSSRILSYWIVVPLFGVTAAFLAFSVKYYRKLLTFPTFLFAMWVFVPLVCTQGYLVGAPVDYNRFLYFLVLPVLVFIGILVDYGSETIALGIEKYRGAVNLGVYKIKVNWRFEGLQRKMESVSKKIAVASTKKRLYSFFVLFFLVFSFVALPIFVTPFLNVGETLQSYYQTMDSPKWEATQWLKQNTAEGSVLVADALYGWWLGGFTQRPTLSAVDPAYLTVNREVDNASFASRLLDTDFIIDNNYTQVREDGFLSRHNPEILVVQNWTYNPYSFFTFGNNGTSIEYLVDGVEQSQVWVNMLVVKDIRMENDSQQATIIVTRGNDDLNYTVFTTVYRNTRFVNITAALSSLHTGVSFEYVHVVVETNGIQVGYNNDLVSIGLVDLGTKSLGQLIFSTTPRSVYITRNDAVVKTIQLSYPMALKDSGRFHLLAGAYCADNEQSIYSNQAVIDSFFVPLVSANVDSALDKMPVDYGWRNFDYRAELLSRNVSFVVLSISQDSNPDKTELDVAAKFSYDPLFNLVFINKEVAIFKINGNFQQAG